MLIYGYDGGFFIVCIEFIFQVLVIEIYNVFLDFQVYFSFSSFVIDIDLLLYISKIFDDVYVGLEMIFIIRDIFFIINIISVEIVMVMDDLEDDGYIMVFWRYDDIFGGKFLRFEYFFILVEQGDGIMCYVFFEIYYNDFGILFLFFVRKQLQDGYV